MTDTVSVDCCSVKKTGSHLSSFIIRGPMFILLLSGINFDDASSEQFSPLSQLMIPV